MQQDCFSAGYWSYTGECVCVEGSTGCYEPVDYSGFDPALCYPFCPASTLTACIRPPEVCPAEVGNAAPDSDQSTDAAGEDTQILSLGQRLQNFLTGPDTAPPIPWRATAGASAAVLLIASFLGLDWLLNTDGASKLLEDLQEWASSLFKPLKQGVERQVARQAGASLAENTADILDSLSNTGAAESGKTEKTPELTPANEAPTPEQLDVDQLAEEFLKGGPTTPGTPVIGPVANPRSRVFDGKDALTILKELGMVPLDTADDAKIPLTRDDLDNYIGSAPDGLPRKITLPSGKTIIVTKIEAIGFEGEDKAVDGQGPRQIDFNKSVVITAELVEEVSQPAPGSPPATGAGGPASAQPPAPSPSTGATIVPQGRGQPGGEPGSSASSPIPATETPSVPAPAPAAGATGPDPQPASQPSYGPVLDVSAEEAAEHDDLWQQMDATDDPLDLERHQEIYRRLVQLRRLTKLDPETGERYVLDGETKEIIQESERLLGGLEHEAPSAAGPAQPPEPAEPGSGAILDGGDISSPTEDF